MKTTFLKNGFCHLNQLINASEVTLLQNYYDDLLADKEKTAHLRSDLSGGKNDKKVERITQIMRPSLVAPELANTTTYEIVTKHVKQLLGDDMALDFDMLINKAPFTNTETPWHQDAAYWMKLPDKRSVSCWIALDDVFEENGCMWFVPRKEDNSVEPHTPLPNGGALFCTAPTSAQQCIPLAPGGCTFHDGFTLHFSKGNSTQHQRRALILNFRPEKMIALERANGVDHTGTRKVRQ